MGGIFHRWRHPTRCYAICAVARSGSNMLADGLRATGYAGKPKRYFCETLHTRYGAQYHLDPQHDYARYLREIVRRGATRNGVFGCKLMGWDLQPFLARLRSTDAFHSSEDTEVALLGAALPRLKFIYIRRRDRLRQAISKARALQSDLWRSDAPSASASEPQFDAAFISHCILDVTREEEIWTEFFARNEVEPFRLEYEDFARDYEHCVGAVLDFAEIRLPRSVKLSPPRTARQADAISAEWEARYKELSAQSSELLSYV